MNVTAQTTKLEPAYSVIRKFDLDGKRGESVLGARLDVDRATVLKWTRSREKGGTGGYIPSRYYDRILEFAEELGIPLDLVEFVKKTPSSNKAQDHRMVAQSC